MEDLLLFIGIGFMAQIIDGCLGMAYGVFSTSTLIAMGVPLPAASASVHFSEIFTTFASGLAHLKLKNTHIPLLKKLVFTGVIGGALGAYFLCTFNSNILKAVIAVYLLILGCRILILAHTSNVHILKIKKIPFLGFCGGFLDAVGGGGWGPIVNTTLIAAGNSPKHTIGTANVAEFFVTTVQSMVFFSVIGLCHWHMILGLIIGGVCASPLSAYMCHKINTKVLMICVGIVVILMNLFNFVNLLK